MAEAQQYSLSRRAAIVTVVALSITALFVLVGYAAQFILLVFAGILVGVLLGSISAFLSRKTGMRYGIALTLVSLALLGILVGGSILLSPTIGKQAEELGKALPESLRKLKEQLEQTGWGKRLLQGMPKDPGKMLSGGGGDVMSKVTGAVSLTLGALANLLIILVTGIYLAVDPEGYKKGFLKLITPGYRRRMDQILTRCYETLKRWLISISITMVVIGVSTGIGLAVLGIKLAVVLGIIAGLLNFIPNLGPYMALVPALLIAFMEGPEKALYVAALYMALQSVEGYILTPMLEKKFVSTRPAVLLFGQVLLGLLLGLTGVVLAAPLIAVMGVLVEELYVKDYLEKRKRVKSEE